MVTHLFRLRESFLPLLLVLIGILGLALFVDARAETLVEAYDVVRVTSETNQWQTSDMDDDGLDGNALGFAVDLEAASQETAKARALAARGQFSAAAASLQTGLAVDPRNPVLLNELGVTFLRMDRHRDAREQLSKAIEARPDYFRAYYNRAIAHHKLGDIDEAEKDYERAVALRPNHFESTYNLGLLKLEQKSYRDAVHRLKQAVALGSGNARAEALFSYARALAKSGQIKGAIRSYKKAIEYRPDYVLPRLNLAIVLGDQADTASRQLAERYLEEIIALNPEFAPAYFVLGRFAAKAGRWGEAARWYSTAANHDSDFFKARYNLGLVHLEQKNWKTANRLFEAMAEDFPDRSEVFFNLGRAAYALEEYPAARGHYENAIATSGGDYTEAELNLAMVLKAEKKADDALAVIDGVLSKHARYAPALLNKGLILLGLKRYDDARQQLLEAEAAGADPVKVNYNLGLLETKLKRFDAAREAYQKALSADPTHLKSAVNLGIVQSKQGDVRGAEAAYRRAVAIAPSYAPAHNYLALTLRKQNRWADAVTEYRAAVELDEDNRSAWHNLGVCLAKLGNAEEAAQMFSKALAIDPANVKARYNLALQYKKLERFDTAEVALRHVLGLDGDHFQAHVSLGDILGTRGQTDDAVRLLERAVEIRPDDEEARLLLEKYKSRHQTQ